MNKSSRTSRPHTWRNRIKSGLYRKIRFVQILTFTRLFLHCSHPFRDFVCDLLGFIVLNFGNRSWWVVRPRDWNYCESNDLYRTTLWNSIIKRSVEVASRRPREYIIWKDCRNPLNYENTSRCDFPSLGRVSGMVRIARMAVFRSP